MVTSASASSALDRYNLDHERSANQKTVFQVSTNHDGRNYSGHNSLLYMMTGSNRAQQMLAGFFHCCIARAVTSEYIVLLSIVEFIKKCNKTVPVYNSIYFPFCSYINNNLNHYFP